MSVNPFYSTQFVQGETCLPHNCTGGWQCFTTHSGVQPGTLKGVIVDDKGNTLHSFNALNSGWLCPHLGTFNSLLGILTLDESSLNIKKGISWSVIVEYEYEMGTASFKDPEEQYPIPGACSAKYDPEKDQVVLTGSDGVLYSMTNEQARSLVQDLLDAVGRYSRI